MIDLLPLLQTHGYWLLFLLIMLEGGIIKYVAAFIASLGVFNIYIVFLIGILGNIISDIFLFSTGKIARKTIFDKVMKHFKLKEEKIQKLRNALKTHVWKTLLVFKTVPPFPVPGLILSGASGMSTKKFLVVSTTITLVQSLIFTILGFYSGVAFNSIFKYLNYGSWLAFIFILLISLLWFALAKLSKKIRYKIEKI